MKKFYLLFAWLVGLFGLTNLSAQSNYDLEPDYDNPLIEDVWQFSSPYSDFLNIDEDGNEYVDTSREGSFYALLDRSGEAAENGYPSQDFWHSSWHSYPVHDVQGSHYFQVEMIDPETLPEQIVFVFTRRNADNDHTTEWSVRGTNDPDASKDQCDEIAYIVTPFSSNTETLVSEPFNPIGYKYLRFYSEVQTGSSYGSRVYFHLARFQLYPLKQISDNEAAQKMLMDAFDKYYEMFDAFPTGYEPGQYDEEAVMAFQDAVFTLDVDEMTDEEIAALTKESAQALIDAVEAAYQAVLASKVTVGFASGYYYIRTGMDYFNDVVVDKDEEGNDITEQQQRVKYMMGHKQDGKYWGIWGTPEDFKEETWKIRPLFRVTNMGGGLYDIESMMYNTRFNDVARSTSVEMTAESENLMAVEAAGTLDGVSYVNIRVSTQDADNYYYLHQNNHSDGTGKNGFLVGWSRTWDEYAGPRASEWVFEPIEDSEAEAIIAAWQPYRDRESWVADYRALYEEAKQAVTAAKDVAHVPLIESEDQLTSPCSDSSEGQHIEYLLDGDAGNFWHSSWHGEYEIEEHHYFQVELLDPENTPNALFSFTRRNTTSGNQIDKWSVWGTNVDFNDDPEMVQGSEGLEKLADITTEYHAGKNDESYMTESFETKGYKYLRFYVEGTRNNDGSVSGNSKFMHLAEFMLYIEKENPNSQYSMMGQVAVDLDNVIQEQAEIADADLTQEDVDKLTAAYNAFKDAFVDPAELREVLASVENKTSIVAVGTNPGFWPDRSTADALDATIAAAKEYDTAGRYTKYLSSKFIETLQAQAAALDSAVNLVKPGKWYRFRYGTEEEYADHEWPTTGNDEDINDEGYVVNEALYGKYVVVADFTSEGGVNTVEPIDVDDVTMNNYVFLDSEEDIDNKDLSLFRFISVGDSAYVIQNKATGLFLLRPGDSSFIRLHVSPSLFTQGIAGWGQNYFPIKNLEGSGLDALHAARNYNILQTYGGWGNTDGRRGCFFVEEVEDVAEDYDGTAFKISANPGTVTTYCFPVSIKGEDGMYGLSAATQTEEGISLTLMPIKEAAAGRPFIFITENVEVPDGEEVEADVLDFAHGYDIVGQPVDGDFLRGTFYKKTVGKGVIINSSNRFGVTKSPSASINDMSAYIVNGEDVFNDKLAVTYTIDANIEDGIQETLQKVASTGDIYTLDGRYVGRGNLRSLRQKGIYIVNGVKVVVK